jgi:hypothetical protein
MIATPSGKMRPIDGARSRCGAERRTILGPRGGKRRTMPAETQMARAGMYLPQFRKSGQGPARPTTAATSALASRRGESEPHRPEGFDRSTRIGPIGVVTGAGTVNVCRCPSLVLIARSSRFGPTDLGGSN